MTVFSPVAGRDGLGLGPLALLPRVGDLAGQVQAVDAGVVALKVLPELLAQVIGEIFQALVVQGGLALPQVVHQQVTDWPAGELVTVDQLVGCQLPGRAELPQPRRRLFAEDPHLMQQPVEHRTVPGRRGVGAGLGIQQFQDVADGDAATMPPLAAMISEARRRAKSPAALEIAGSPAHRSRSRANPCRVTGPGKVADQGTLAGQAGHQPAQRGADEVGADRHPQRAGELARSHRERWPRSCSHRIGSCAQPAPAASAPLASQRSCQV